MSVTEGLLVRRLVLVCGPVSLASPGPFERVSARPAKAEIDPLLAAHPDVPLVVAGTDADLAAVVVRLLRKGKLASTPVGLVPAEASEVARLWGLPTDHDRALEVALSADPQPVPVARDDAGGVLVGKGTFGALKGMAYCDDTLALRGPARSIEVWPDRELGLAVQVRTGRFKRGETLTTRAFQLACEPARPTRDGVPYPRTVERWTWYRHTEDLQLIGASAQQH
ncbi:hypothetical protein [Amycolatopsis taiwanensis]|uniref:DAGKc domain-containing protein n=1 Tax=Amycolatopsis taiwanensis TaxID=342230 RepID=A0A9W6VDI3_9PSEU|nr:hypothetical protein [Amycolatopsis taiwanensis]GLY67358.1 hypothetical protein Atai01_39770 [Amycolatopsis taiwanensis]